MGTPSFLNDYHQKTVPLFASLPSIDAWFPTRTVVELHSGCAYGCHYCPASWQKIGGEIGQKVGESPQILQQTKVEQKIAKNPQIGGKIGQQSKILLHNPIIQEENHPQFLAEIKQQHHKVLGFGAGYTDPFPPENPKNDGSNDITQQYEKTLELLLIKSLQNHNHLLIMTKNPQKLLSLLEKNQKKLTNAHWTQITVISSIIFPDDQNPHFALLEPHLPKISARWSALGQLKKLGATVGLAYLPIIGGVNDNPADITATLERGKKENIDFCLFGELSDKAHNYLAEKKIVSPTKIKKASVEDFFIQTLKKLKIQPLPPIKNLIGKLSKRDLAIVYLKQLYLYQNWLGKNKQHFLNAALSLEKSDDAFFERCLAEKKETNPPLSLCSIHQIGPQIEKLLKTLILKKKTTYLQDSSKFFR